MLAQEEECGSIYEVIGLKKSLCYKNDDDIASCTVGNLLQKMRHSFRAEKCEIIYK